jgi:hypothetical protein
MTLHSKAGREAMQRFSWQFLVSSESPERESFGLQSAQASITLAFIPYSDAILLSASENKCHTAIKSEHAIFRSPPQTCLLLDS